MNKESKSYIVVFIKGMMMGIADIIPGVSGGTIAIITGVYEEFLSTLNNLNINIFRLILKMFLSLLRSIYLLILILILDILFRYQNV